MYHRKDGREAPSAALCVGTIEMLFDVRRDVRFSSPMLRIMARTKKDDRKKTNNGANVGYEAELWQMADALRGSMDAAIAADLRELGYGE